MKHLFKLLFAIAAVILTSCGPTDNYGYPGKVTFEKEGGTQTVEGHSCPFDLEIDDYNGNLSSQNVKEYDDDSLRTKYDWLTLKCSRAEDRIHITAAPNTTGHKRKLYVYGWMGDYSAEITVTQK